MNDYLAVMKLDIILEQANITQATPDGCISCSQISDLSVPEAESVVSRFVMNDKKIIKYPMTWIRSKTATD